RQLELARQPADHRLGEAGRAVEPGADRGAAERQLADRAQGPSDGLGGAGDLRRVAGELLAEGHRGGVHEVGAPRLHHRVELLGLGPQRRRQVLERGQQRPLHLPDRGDVDGRGEHVVRRLRGVDLVVGVHGAAQALRGQAGDDLVGVHVRARAGAGLEHVDREVVVVAALRHLGRGLGDGPADVLGQDPQLGVGQRGGALDAGEGGDERPRQPHTRDGEVLHGPLGLRAPQGPGRHVDLAHRVALDAVLGARIDGVGIGGHGSDGTRRGAGRLRHPRAVPNVTRGSRPAYVSRAMTEFAHTELLPLGPDETTYRLVDTEGIGSFTAGGHRFLTVEPEVLTRLTALAMHEIAHYLRPGHLKQLRQILDDPEASANDRFVALDLLKNACISAGGVLPMCQDTGTAIVKGKKGQFVFTGGGDEEAIARGVFETYQRDNLRYSQMAPLTTWDEVNTR